MVDRILFVDDEPFMLESLKRELGDQFQIDTALNGLEGLEKLDASQPYAVVVADYRMPKMDGVAFLRQVMIQSPDSVRIMLTGNVDLQMAMEAVNEGQIFRLLTKPCSPSLLSRSLEAGLKQYHLVIAEKELLEITLLESINMLTEILSIVNPKAYGKSLRVRQLVRFISDQMQLPGAWQYEMAAALSQLGWIIFPQDLLDKIDLHQTLSVSETLLFSRHPFTTKKLLEKIPRLEKIAKIIEGQFRSIVDLNLEEDGCDQYFIDHGAHILSVCVDYDQLVLLGYSHSAAIDQLFSSEKKYKPEIVEALGRLKSAQVDDISMWAEEVNIEDLETGMLIVEPIRDFNKIILFEKNTVVTRLVILELLKLSSRPSWVIQPIKVVRTKR